MNLKGRGAETKGHQNKLTSVSNSCQAAPFKTKTEQNMIIFILCI